MYDDDVRIRLAKPAEAEELTDIAWRSKGYWDYPSEVMSRFRGLLTIKQDFVEANPTYLIEHDDTGEKLGFYALEKKNGGWWLRHMWVLPEEIGTGLGGKLVLHACETVGDLMATDRSFKQYVTDIEKRLRSNI